MTTNPAVSTSASSGRLFLASALGLTVLGIVAYIVQVASSRLQAPWYLPLTASVGVLLLVFSLWYRRSLWRVLALVLVVLLAAFEWMFLLGARLPAYDGPIAAGQPFPAFATQRADGSPFTERDLAGEQPSVLVFFRGRW